MKNNHQKTIGIQDINQALFERSLEGLLVFNMNKNIRLANPSAERLLGYEPGELNNLSLYEIVPPQYHEECQKLWNLFFSKLNDKEGIKTNVTLLKKNKQKLVAEISISNHIHDTEGSFVVALFSDITERFKTENLLKEEKRLYENVLERLGDAFMSLDHNWNFTYVNTICLNLMQKPKKEIIGKNIWEIFPELKGSIFEKKYRQVMEDRSQISFESRSLFRERWYEIRISPHDGGIAIFSRDITEVKNKTEALIKSEDRFAKAFRSGPIALAILRLSDGTFRDVNDNFLNTFECRHEDVIGKTPQELALIKEIDSEEIENTLAQLHKNGYVRNKKMTLKNTRGTPMLMLLSGEMIQLNDENHILITMIDVSAQKQAEDAMIQLNEMLERTVRDRTLKLTQALNREKENNDLKSRFVSMASHEFRTPLTALLSSVSILEIYTAASQNEKLTKHFNRIKSSVNTLTEILNDFLSLEKIDTGQTKTSAITFNLNELITDVIEGLKASLKKGQQIHYQNAGDIEIIQQDKKIIYNTLLNLLSNASKYSDNNKSIELTTEIKNGKVTISVKDYGIGIPLEEQHNLFSLFFRAKNAEPIQGTGLGLYIVKKYMELIGGTIYFESEENKGSVFKISFPKQVKKD